MAKYAYMSENNSESIVEIKTLCWFATFKL